MRLRTEDALGFFSTQMLGQLALPSVAREAAARAVFIPRGRASGKAAAMRIAKEVWPGAGTDSSTGLVPAADTKPQAGANLDPAAQFTERLGVCGCGAPAEAMSATLRILGGLHTRGYPKAEELPAEGLRMLALYLLDDRGLLEHGSSLCGAWLTKKGLEFLSWLEQADVASEPPEPRSHDREAWRRCACSRLVPEALWDGLYDSCSDCADRSAAAGDNWRDYMREQDCLRLLGEFTD
jgi:hypothetical protein